MGNATSPKKSLWRGIMMKCPRCGEGKLFNGYLKREAACPHCHESFDGLDADDGPAWLTIGLTAHIVIPLLIFLERGDLLPLWQEFSILAVVTIACALLLLPLSKGFFIAAMWLTARKSA
ncbi:DUF983 domain-containing protein [Methylocystis sp. ATCC 49242]|uniref:DUF983 domain-containing protein n=1 Tax=Methylocystis sp. ATCC 49242 TaxID=622637 RepID=UPI0001F86EA8|nr:DUF983 domain-containing protein [Methylocystis sp. ATCC 49242]